MINQVNFKGYLARSWEHRDQLYMRLANLRPGEVGRRGKSNSCRMCTSRPITSLR